MKLEMKIDKNVFKIPFQMALMAKKTVNVICIFLMLENVDALHNKNRYFGICSKF